MSRRLLAVLGILATVFVLAAHGQDRVPKKIDTKNKDEVKRDADSTDPKIKIEDAATQQERLKRSFEEFRQKLVGLAQRLENSTKPEDQEKAKILRMAIKKASEEGVETRFSSLIERLRGSDAFKNTEQLQDILSENEKLRQNLREILDLLTKDDRDAQIRAEKEAARKLLEELKTVIRRQELVLTKTIVGRSKNADLAQNQKNVREATDRLVNPKDNKGSEAKHGEGKDSKSGKQGVGEAKNDAKDPKADPKESKGGEGKDGKSGEGKDGKPSESKDGKSGEGKDAKSGEGKSGEGKDGKSGEGKDSKNGKDGKSGEGKDSKNGKDGKSGEGKDGKPGEAKSGQPKAGQPKSGESKPGDGKSGDSKGKGEGKGDSKGSSGKPGQSGQGKPSEGKPGQSGQPGQPGQQGESKSDSQSGKQQQQQQPQQSQEQTQIKKKIQDAEKYQEKAEGNLRKDNRKDAPEDEEKALAELNKAKKDLEDLLRQLREEEIERLLARLEARCRHMLAMQIVVRDGTVELDKVIQTNPNTQPTRADQQASNVLSDREDEIVKEARAGLKLLEDEGSAVAFAEVFQQVKGDMETVSGRLRKTDTGVVTVTIENQIIETLQEMIEALKKAQADNKNKKSGQPGQSGPPPDPKLIDLLAELRMIRSMQKRVNDRTELYGKQYAGEQAPIPESGNSPDERERYDRIQNELKDLSKRQQKIGKVTHDIATGKNESK